MKKKDVVEGDVILIPAGEQFVPAKVLYRSKYFRGVILIGLYNLLVEPQEQVEELPEKISVLLYTGRDPITAGRWPCINNFGLRASEEGHTKRIVGGEVWVEDRCEGVASDEDIKQLPKMLVKGATLVERAAEQLAAGLRS